MLLGVGLSLIALVATPLAARVTHRRPDPDSGYMSTTIMALLITAAYGVGAISMIIAISDLGSTATWILIPAYCVAMVAGSRLAWKTLGPDAATAAPKAGVSPLGA